eukprot:CAMPEP_0184228404 /NCGR_PEP_ID=MMETSP0976-20121227/21740_1 /TAXON_ID=483370 /ORGANISM="non described non described, Strain CCMP2097" /LENGTH=37 /DNA_ID= /DNA_START= /DNA_END= /DNA_ORIENTATION=
MWTTAVLIIVLRRRGGGAPGKGAAPQGCALGRRLGGA